MTKKDLFKAIDEVDIELIDSAISYKPRKSISFAFIGSVAAMLLLVLGAAFVIRGTLDSPLSFISTTTNEETTTRINTTLGAIYIEPSWEEKAVTEKFTTVSYEGREYYVLGNTPRKKITKKTKTRLGVAELYGTQHSTNEEYSIKATIYSLENISPEFMLAVKFDEHDGLYAYVNSSFKVSTFGEFISATDFINIAELGDFNYGDEGQKYKGELLGDKSTFLGFFSNDMPYCEDDANFLESLIEIRVDAPEIGITNRYLAVYPNGSVQTNLFDVAYTFKLSSEALELVKEYIYAIKEENTGFQINNYYEETESALQDKTTVPIDIYDDIEMAMGVTN